MLRLTLRGWRGTMDRHHKAYEHMPDSPRMMQPVRKRDIQVIDDE